MNLFLTAEQHTNNSGAITCHSAGSVPCLEVNVCFNTTVCIISSSTKNFMYDLSCLYYFPVDMWCHG